MSKSKPWIKERTVTVGTGNITLNGAIARFAAFSTGFSAEPVWYSIEDANGNKEEGLADFNGSTTLIRTTVYATLLNGVLNTSNPTPIPLSGSAIVSCTFNSTAYEELAQYLEMQAEMNGILIKSADDFPNRVGDVSTFDANKPYWIKAGMQESIRWVMADGVSLFGYGVYNQEGYDYQGTGDLITASGIGFTIDNLSVQAPNANQVLNVSGAETNSMFADKFRIFNATKLGTFNGAAMVMNNFVANGFSDGFSFQGSPIIGHSVVNAFMEDDGTSSAVFWDWGDAQFYQLAMQGVEMEGNANATYFSSTDAVANMLANTDAVIANCTFGISQQGTVFNGFPDAEKTVGWEFKNNSPTSVIKNTVNAGDMYLSSAGQSLAVTQNVFSEIGTPDVGRDWLGSMDSRLSVNSAGYIENTGNKELTLLVSLNSVIDHSGGGADLIEQRLAIDWVPGDNVGLGIRSQGNSQAGNYGTLSSCILVTLPAGSNLRPIYTNRSDNSGLNFQAVSLTLLGVA